MGLSPDAKERLGVVFGVVKTTFHWGFIPTVLYLGKLDPNIWIIHTKFKLNLKEMKLITSFGLFFFVYCSKFQDSKEELNQDTQHCRC